jgi:hypothetical protein
MRGMLQKAELCMRGVLQLVHRAVFEKYAAAGRYVAAV